MKGKQDILVTLRLELSWAAKRCEIATIFFDFSLTVKAAPHECVIWTSQP